MYSLLVARNLKIRIYNNRYNNLSFIHTSSLYFKSTVSEFLHLILRWKLYTM